MGRRLVEVPELVRTSERWVVDISGREKSSVLVGRLVESSGLLKVSSMMKAARLHLGASRLNRGKLLLPLVVHNVVPAA